MNATEKQFVVACIVVLVLALVVSAIVAYIHRAARRHFGATSPVEKPAPGGWILGLMESFFYFAVLSIEGAALLAGAWLAFKVATRWQSAAWAKPTELETKVGYRAFQVGTVGTLLIGVIGAAIVRS